MIMQSLSFNLSVEIMSHLVIFSSMIVSQTIICIYQPIRKFVFGFSEINGLNIRLNHKHDTRQVKLSAKWPT